MVPRPRLEQREVDIMRRMKRVMKFSVYTIAACVGRERASVRRALKASWKAGKRGRRPLLPRPEVDRLVRILHMLIKKADGKYEVSMAILRRTAKTTVSEKTIRKAFLKRNIRFRRLREKPLLTAADRCARLAFARAYKDKPALWWLRSIHLYIDLKLFPVYTTAAARKVGAHRTLRGAYRQPGQGLDEAYVVQPKRLAYNPGVRSARVAAGMGAGRVRLWEEVKGSWTGQAAAKLYKGALLHAVQRGWPGKRRFSVLEDNDPTGFKSRAGIQAKHDAKLTVFAIPPRSPDLSPCDYGLWAEVNRRMRRAERSFPTSKRETRAEYVDRLRRTAKALPRRAVEKILMDMKRRCHRCFEARGGHFAEGGRGGC